MNVVDSSGWLEYFADTLQAKHFSSPIEDTENLVVPTITLFEVFKKILKHKDEGKALQAVALMQQGQIVDLDMELSLNAGKLSVEHGLPMADSLILATAQNYNATLWTQDSDFRGLEGVKYIPKGNKKR
jgi:predicted nucleic acid-binding protein